jgi:hypothetical protein
MLDDAAMSDTPTEEEIAYSVAAFISELGKRGADHHDKTRIIFSVAVNAVMLFITTTKLLTGDTTEQCRKHVMQLVDEQIARSDQEGDRIITWQEEGEASA